MRQSLLRRARRRLHPNDRGASSVEFALLFPIFLVLCFGTISGGIVFSDKLALTQGVREAARYGATLPYTAGNTTAFLTQIRQAAVDADYGQIGSGEPSYCVAFRNAAGATSHLKATSSTAEAGACPGTSGMPTHPHVLVTVTKPASFNLLLYTSEIKIGSTSVARFEGPA